MAVLGLVGTTASRSATRMVSTVVCRRALRASVPLVLAQRTARGMRPVAPNRHYATVQQPRVTVNGVSDDRIEDIFIDMKTLMRNNDLATLQRRSLKLKSLVLDLVGLAENNELNHEQLLQVTEVLNFLADGKYDFTDDEILQVLTATVGAITLDDIQTCYFFPVMYKQLRASETYAKDATKRLLIFEIFVNYVALSKKRDHLQRLIQEFANEHPEEGERVARIVLEAFSGNSEADSETLLSLFELNNLKDVVIMDELIGMTLATLEEEKIHTEASDLESKVDKLCEYIKQKYPVPPILELVSVLHFASTNGCDNAAQQTLKTLDSLVAKAKSPLRDEDLSALVTAALKYRGNEHIAKRALEAVDSPTSLERLVGLQHEVYLGVDIESVKTKVSDLVEEFGPELVYNTLLKACVYSSKPQAYINQLSEFFDEEYNLDMNAETFAIRIENSLKDGDFESALKAFSDSQRSMVHWGQDTNGAFMETIFKLLSSYAKRALEDSSISVNEVFQLMVKVKSYGQNLRETEIAPLLKLMLANDYAGDALELLDRELPPRVGKQRLHAENYPSIFQSLHDFVLNYNGDAEVNWAVYGYIHKVFWVPFDSYLPAMKVFCEKGRPNAAHIIFNKVRSLHKEEGFPPPTEEMYTYLFKEFGRQLYEDGVFRLHLALKMDLSVNLDIELLNSVLEGYTHLQDFLKARDIFELARSLPKDRGINQDTMTLMLKAMTYVNLRTVKQLWNNMSQYEVLPDSRNFEQYLIAHCFHEEYEEALQLVDTQRKEKDIEITPDVLKTLHNWTIDPEQREKVIEWSEQNYPQLWSGLRESGQLSQSIDYPSLIDGKTSIVGT